MGFLGIKGSTWKKIGKIALKAAPIVAAPFTGGASLLAIGAGSGALSGAMGGGGWKGALLGGGLGAIPGGGVGGAAAGTAGKVGLRQLATGLAKGAAQNFATGTATGLATGQGLKGSLRSGLQSTGDLSLGGAGGFGQAAKDVGRNVAMNVGGQYASNALQRAGVPGAAAAQGANVFTNYLGNQFQPGTSSFAPGAPSGLPQQTTGGGSWRDILTRAGVGAVQGVGGQPSPTYPTGATGGASATGGGSGGGGGAAAPRTTDPSKPPGFWERYGPLIAQGGGVVGGALLGRQATKNAMQRSPEELAALQGAQQAAGQAGQHAGRAFGRGDEVLRQGREVLGEGRNYLRAPGQYFQTLLGGNRAAMSQMLAGPTAQITANYRGAGRALDQAGVRGAGRDQALADLNRQRVSQIAGLATGVQPYAAEQLKSMGETMVGQAPGLFGAGASLYGTGGGLAGTAGNIYGGLLGYGAENRRYARLEGEKTAGAVGGLARDLGETVFRRPPQQGGGQGNGPSTVYERPGGPAPTNGNGAPATAPATPPAQGGTLQPPPGYPSRRITRPTFGGQAPPPQSPYGGIDFGASSDWWRRTQAS